MTRWLCALGSFVLLATSAEAEASNGVRSPVPPVFHDAPVVTQIDAPDSAGLRYAVPREDLQLSEDEPPNSRTLQFFALCRDIGPAESLPQWVSWADFEEARTYNATLEEPSDEDVLETSALGLERDPQTGGPCVRVLNDASARRPIDCDSAAEKVSVGSVVDGPATATVWAYTYEPPVSMWTRRPGVIRIGDGGPAADFVEPLGDMEISVDAGVVFDVSVSADVVSVTLRWARAKDLQTWVSEAPVEVTGPDVQLAFRPPPETEYEALFMRVEALDEDGNRWISNRQKPVVVFPGCSTPQGTSSPRDNACGEEIERATSSLQPAGACGNAPGDEEEDTGADSDSESPEDSEDAPGREDTAAEPPVQGCRVGDTKAPLSVFGLLLITMRRRRRWSP